LLAGLPLESTKSSTHSHNPRGVVSTKSDKRFGWLERNLMPMSLFVSGFLLAAAPFLLSYEFSCAVVCFRDFSFAEASSYVPVFAASRWFR
jgi:hypothetical protein